MLIGTWPFRRQHAQVVELGDVAVAQRKADANVDFLVGVVGAVFAHPNAVGDQLDDVADRMSHRRRSGPACARSTESRHSIPGMGRLSSRSTKPTTPFMAVRIFATASSRAAGSRPLSRTWIALPVGGPFFGFADFDANAREVRRVGANLCKDLFGRAALVPIEELDVDGADDIGRVRTSGAAARGACVRGLDARDGEDAVLDLAHQRIFFLDRHVAARVHQDAGIVGIDVGEESDAVAGLQVVAPDPAEHQTTAVKTTAKGRRTRKIQRANVQAGEAGHRRQVAGFRRRPGGPRRVD